MIDNDDSNMFRASVNVFFAACILVSMSGCTTLAYTTASVVGKNQTLGSQIDDAVLERHANAVLDSLHLNKDLNNIKLTTYDQNVLITGQTQSSRIRSIVANMVSQVQEVTKVYNYLSVAPVRSHARWIQDGYITTKVKANLMVSDASHFHFEYLTEDGVVYIMGNAPPAELKYVSHLISEISGVKKVVTIFPQKITKKTPIYDVLPVALDQ